MSSTPKNSILGTLSSPNSKASSSKGQPSPAWSINGGQCDVRDVMAGDSKPSFPRSPLPPVEPCELSESSSLADSPLARGVEGYPTRSHRLSGNDVESLDFKGEKTYAQNLAQGMTVFMASLLASLALTGMVVMVLVAFPATRGLFSNNGSSPIPAEQLFAPEGFTNIEPSLSPLDDNDWHRAGRVASGTILNFVVAIAHYGAAELKSRFECVTDPDCELFQEHMSIDDIKEITRTHEGARAVANWLQDTNTLTDINVADSGDYVSFSMTAAAAEDLLRTRFYVFERVLDGKTENRFSCDRYFVPDAVSEFIEFIAGNTPHSYPTPLPAPLFEDEKNAASPALRGAENAPSASHIITDDHKHKKDHKDKPADTPSTPTNEDPTAPSDPVEGSPKTTPALINKVYNIRNNVVADKRSTQGLFESLGQQYSEDDLAQFCRMNDIPVQHMAEVIGKNDPSQCFVNNGANCGEANLDAQFLAGVAQEAHTVYYSLPGKTEPFLEWLMMVADDKNPPLVHSISYGDAEVTLDKKMMERFNYEAMKLGLRGVSLVAASGDDGVSGDITRDGKREKCSYRPMFPAGSPYVTAVGATMLDENDREIAQSADRAGGITSGGGFSGVFDMPAFQAEAVHYYETSGLLGKAQAGYSKGGRAYPDVALLGHQYEIVIGGKVKQVDGTSASSPVFTAMLTLVNGDRLAAGKKPIGFVTPLLYRLKADLPEVFHEITEGSNHCGGGKANYSCCDQGFTTGPYWNPVTGLGSVDFEALRRALFEI